MKKISRQYLASRAASSWYDVYMDKGVVKDEYRDPSYCDKGAIYVRLVALGIDPTPQQVDLTIGNGSWTRLTCGECKKDVDEVVSVGGYERYEIKSVYLCESCARKIVELYS